ncbi:MAG TPA: 30S ribosomal protein S6 [Erysipelothrix sp.]|nr:30S ribosomal protein S6 [Erysipelothrix sp.]
MNKYELMYIVNVNLDDAETAETIERMHAILTDNGATIDKVDEWGLREFAYEINFQKQGYYVVTTFTSGPEAVSEFRRLARINKRLVRHMIVRLDREN